MGRIIMGIRKKLMEKRTRLETERERIMVGNIKKGEEKWKIIEVNVKKERFDRTIGEVERWMEEKDREENIIIGGDFNARNGGRRSRKRRRLGEEKRKGVESRRIRRWIKKGKD